MHTRAHRCKNIKSRFVSDGIKACFVHAASRVFIYVRLRMTASVRARLRLKVAEEAG